MSSRRVLIAAGLVLSLLAAPYGAAVSASGGGAAAADAAYKQGDFERAKMLDEDALRADATDVAAEVGLARIELYENHLDLAMRHATHVLSIDPNNVLARRVIATCSDRKLVATASDRMFTPPHAPASLPPNQAVIPFLRSEPLPLLQLRIDGHEANLILDTGAPDIVIDPTFAHEIGLTVTAGSTGVFAGGRTAEVREATVHRVEAGPFTLEDLRVGVIPTRGMLPYEGVRVDGVVGTVFLSRFLATIDYPRNRLVLERPVTANPRPGAIVTRMWLVGDHFVFARGSVNALDDQLFMVDSGLAGGGFGAEESTVKSAHIRTMPEKASSGMGGGGEVQFIPAVVDRLCVATACQRDVPAMYTPGGSPAAALPFRIAGMVSDKFLRHYAVTFDFTGMHLILTPA